jgi:hypothetical protein
MRRPLDKMSALSPREKNFKNENVFKLNPVICKRVMWFILAFLTQLGHKARKVTAWL